MRAGQVAPGRGRSLSARNHCLAIAQPQHPPKEVEYMREGSHSGHRHSGSHLFSGIGIQLHNAEVKAAERWVGQKGVDQLAGELLLRRQPVFRPVEDFHPRRRKIQLKRPVAAQRLFEFGQREPRVDGQECTRGVYRLKDDLAATPAPHAEAQDSEKVRRLRRLALFNFEDSPRTRKSLQFPCLADVAEDQFQVLGLLQTLAAAHRLVAAGDDVARQCGEHLRVRQIRRKRGHAGKAGHRPWDDHLARGHLRRAGRIGQGNWIGQSGQPLGG